MGYSLRAFIGHTHDLQPLATQYDHAVLVEVGQGLSLIPITEVFFDELNMFSPSEEIMPFGCLTRLMEERVLALLGPTHFGYLEADYFGGRGGQASLLWQAGQRSIAPSAINSMLRELGVIATGHMDEFDTIKLGRHRETEDWVSV
ncbi:hypothetical protein [Hymenobacter sublimis]|uniref:Uncharacterized protein n=1 Tax=Hymenobacter sublimis TaxID=2933777 RepID=A0ABY4JC34_9BACT|nr:hypothetical protein [Hymenobacter sublimis]UPL50375.1 hypothetical protein MWH26_05565 [Hymenobacter sublimis]